MRRGQSRSCPDRFLSTGETVTEASKRLGVSLSTIRARKRYGWTEEDALRIKKHGRYPPEQGRAPKGAKPGVARNPLTARELAILQMIAEGFTPTELAGTGSVRAIRRSLHLIRIKLDAFTNEHAVAEGIWRNLVKRKEQK